MKTPPLLSQDIDRPADFSSEFFTTLARQRDEVARGMRPQAIHQDDGDGEPPPAPVREATALENAVKPLAIAVVTHALDSEFFTHLASEVAMNALAIKPHRTDANSDPLGEAAHSTECSGRPLVNPWMAMQASLDVMLSRNLGLAMPVEAGWHAHADLLTAALAADATDRAMYGPQRTNI